MQPDSLKELVEGKFVDALRAVAAEMAMEELHELPLSAFGQSVWVRSRLTSLRMKLRWPVEPEVIPNRIPSAAEPWMNTDMSVRFHAAGPTLWSLLPE